MTLDGEPVAGHRVRPSRRARWRRYLPGAVAAGLGLAVVAGADPIARLGASASLGPRASLTVAAALGAALAVLAAFLADRTPVAWYVGGALAVSLGANLASPRWLAAPLAAAGLAGILAREVERSFDGVTLGSRGVTLHRPLSDPLTVRYGDLRAVHTTPPEGPGGTLIFETEHGTVTASDLPDVQSLQARIEARMRPREVEEPARAARRAREAIRELVGGRSSA